MTSLFTSLPAESDEEFYERMGGRRCRCDNPDECCCSDPDDDPWLEQEMEMMRERGL